MRTTYILAGALALAATPAFAKQKLIPLAPGDAAGLQGKSLALSVHEAPTFMPMTAGKAGFGLFGVAAMAGAGKTLVTENQIADPAGMVREQLSALLRDAYGAQPLQLDATLSQSKKPKDIAAAHPNADFVLDVRSTGWTYVYFPTQWARYAVYYNVQVKLLDKDGREVSNAACNTGTHDHPKPPSREQLHAQQAALLKDVLGSLAWNCVHILARDQFAIAADKLPPIPAQYADPLSRVPETDAGAPVGVEAVPQPVTVQEPATNSDAVPPVETAAPTPNEPVQSSELPATDDQTRHG